MNIKKRWESIQKRLLKAHDDMQALQAECTHDNVNKVYRGDRGNYCRSDDSFWIEFKCPDCGKQWTEDQ